MVGLVPTPTDRTDYYPDPYGVRTLSWSNTSATVGTSAVLALQDVSDWASLLIRNVGTGLPANASVWTVRWFADPQGALQIGADPCVFAPGVEFDVALPTRGPYVSISAASITGAGSHPAGGWVGVGSYPAAHYHAMRRRIAGSDGAPSITAGAVRTDAANAVVNGLAKFLGGWESATAASFEVTALDPTNTARTMWWTSMTTTFQTFDRGFHLPPWPVTVKTQNNDTVARQIRYSLTTGP